MLCKSEQYVWERLTQYDSRAARQPETFDAISHSFEGNLTLLMFGLSCLEGGLDAMSTQSLNSLQDYIGPQNFELWSIQFDTNLVNLPENR